MTARTAERWPPADILVDYLKDFAQEQDAAGRIVYNSSVAKISRATDTSTGTGTTPASEPFDVTVIDTTEGSAANTRVVRCGAVVNAAGIAVPNIPTTLSGIEHTDGYEDLPETGEGFERQSVAVLGFGNAAFETADALAPYANYVHLMPGRHRELDAHQEHPEATAHTRDDDDDVDTASFANEGIKDLHDFVSWESRYVGNLRAINAGLLDAYLLKSLDGVAAHPTADGVVMVPCSMGLKEKICMFLKDTPVQHRDGTLEATVSPGRFSPHDETAMGLIQELHDLGLVASINPVPHSRSRVSVGLSGATNSKGQPYLASGKIRTDVKDITLFASAITNRSLVDRIAELARRSGTPYPLVYDKVIRALGWKHDLSVYEHGGSKADAKTPQGDAESGRGDAAGAQGTEKGSNVQVRPILQPNGKYAVMTPGYESVNVPGLYIAGTLSHGRDFRRAAGGF